MEPVQGCEQWSDLGVGHTWTQVFEKYPDLLSCYFSIRLGDESIRAKIYSEPEASEQTYQAEQTNDRDFGTLHLHCEEFDIGKLQPPSEVSTQRAFGSIRCVIEKLVRMR